MSPSPHLATAHISLERICGNYRRLSAVLAAAGQPDGQSVAIPLRDGKGMQFTWPSLMPVVKSDAYGHGHIEVARALVDQEGVTLFASGHVREAAALRRGLAAGQARSGKMPALTLPLIVSLLGPTSLEDLRLCADFGIIPAIHSPYQISWLQALDKPLPVAVKCNSGMGRLGFNPAETEEAVKRLKGLPQAVPVLALSHLAKADAEEAPAAIRVQAETFAGMLEPLRRNWPDMAVSLCNSAGLLQSQTVTQCLGRHICRPGIALYGGNPLHGTALAPLGKDFMPAMAVSAPIIAERTLMPGEGVGYGHSFVAENAMRIGIIAAGYADHLSRGLSNKGVFCAGGIRTRVLGRVSMQMTAVDLSRAPTTGTGDAVWLLGGPGADAVRVEELADNWGTISYEVLCLLGANSRKYQRSAP